MLGSLCLVLETQSVRTAACGRRGEEATKLAELRLRFNVYGWRCRNKIAFDF